MKLTELKPNTENPRTIEDAKFQKLVESIRDFPKMLELRPIIVDRDNLILGGNMRFKALLHLGYTEIPDKWVKRADELTEDEKQRFTIVDNIGYGDWDFGDLDLNWDVEELTDWGLDMPEEDWGVEETLENMETSDTFSLPDGDKEPFQQMTFTLADNQAEQVKNAIADIKQTEEYNYVETFGNENSNGNALYLIIMQWGE